MAAIAPSASPRTSSPKGIAGSSCVRTCRRRRARSFSTGRDRSGYACTWFATRFSPWHEDPSRRVWRSARRDVVPAVGIAEVHQSGSHIIVETSGPTHERIAIPGHRPVRIGTFMAVLRAVARHKGVSGTRSSRVCHSGEAAVRAGSDARGSGPAGLPSPWLRRPRACPTVAPGLEGGEDLAAVEDLLQEIDGGVVVVVRGFVGDEGFVAGYFELLQS